MSGSGNRDDDRRGYYDPFGTGTNWLNDVRPLNNGSNIALAPYPKVGLFGGQYADMMNAQAANGTGPNLVDLGAPADFSTDGTGLPPSVTLAGNLPFLTDPAASLQQVLAYTGNDPGAPSPAGFSAQVPAMPDGSLIFKPDGAPVSTPLPLPNGQQAGNAIPLSAAAFAPNDQQISSPGAGANGAPSRAGGGNNGIDQAFIFGQENKKIDDPTRITLPIPDSVKGDIDHSIYANTGFTGWGGVDYAAGKSKEATIQQWKRWGASDHDINTVDPIIGPKGEAAEAYLDQLPGGLDGLPRISRESAEAMRQGALSDRIAAVRKAYNQASPPISFEKLPGDVQTAIVDLAYQTPGITGGAAPKFWHQVTTGDWSGAAANLNDYYGPSVTATDHDRQRRRNEAGLIQGALNRGLLHDSSN